MKRNSLCQAKRLWDSFCGRKDEVLRIKFLSLKASAWGLAVALRFCVEWRVTAGRLSIRRRICVIISPATLATLVGHLRGEEKNILKTPRAISWRDWTGNFRQNRAAGQTRDGATVGWPEGRAEREQPSQFVKISARTHSRGKWERLKCRPKQASLLAIGFLTFKTSVAEVSAPISETLAKASASQQYGSSF